MSKCFFTIQKGCLSEEILGKLINHDMYGYDYKVFSLKNNDPDIIIETNWVITITEDIVIGSGEKSGSGFDMKQYLSKIGIKDENVTWSV